MKGSLCFFMLLLFGLLPLQLVEANGVAEQIRQGVSDYQHHHYAAATGEFSRALKRRPSSPIAAFDLGTAAFRQHNYRKALESFKRAATNGSALAPFQARADYNQGESLAKMGDAAARTPHTALEEYLKSIDAFQRALQINPMMKQAGYNIEVIRHRIKRLKRRLKRRARADSRKRKAAGKRKGTGRGKAAGTPTSHGRRSGSNGTGGRSSRKAATGSAAPAGTSGPPRSIPATTPKGGSRAAHLTAQQILREESNHPRIVNIASQQVRQNVGKNW